ncbi:MAG: hypothetical protein F6K40_38150 [Okeania sp. SIO3I5]|uniref:hypothetical protein n=1 Tax=Okeania sp. SIO3I5 TaxID=2607805 RepID=UPI0013BB38B8|nr:hypothetical protein [Okeania sp. SIO3I5]NEQ41700.1 hypothetical protein [Okeania sp. SIO3I5]
MKFSRLISIGFLSLILTAFGIETTQAQRSKGATNFVSLTSKLRECNRNGYFYWKSRNGNISIGKQLEPYIARVNFDSENTIYTLVCKINPKGTTQPFGTFRFTFGVDEFASNVQIEVKVYLDGKITAGHTVNRGEIKTLLLDVANSEDMAIEFQTTNDGPYLYILDDNLVPLE